MNDASIAQQLCENWQKSTHRQNGFSLDELSAFMTGVMAGLAYQRNAENTSMGTQQKGASHG